MSTVPPFSDTALLSVNTVGQLASRVERWAREPVETDIVYDAIGDAIESLHMSATLATLSKFTKGPVQQLIPASASSVQIVTLPDPVLAPALSAVAGGTGLPARTVYAAYCLVTDSGSTTRISPLSSIALPAGQLVSLSPPLVTGEAIGWYWFLGSRADGADLGLQSTGLESAFGTGPVEVATGAAYYPDAPAPPSTNTTGDNVLAVERLDIANADGTSTTWNQTTLAGSLWGHLLHRQPLNSSYQSHAYDVIEGNQIAIAPAAGRALSASFFYLTRPRRPRFPQSRIPFTSFSSQAFLFYHSLAAVKMGLEEFEGAGVWEGKANAERKRIVDQISQANLYRDNTVRPFRT